MQRILFVADSGPELALLEATALALDERAEPVLLVTGEEAISGRGATMAAVERGLRDHGPDLVAVAGDVGPILVAAKAGVPVAHVGAGSPRGPAAPLVEAIADLCLATSPEAAERLAAEGIPAGRVRVLDPVIDLVAEPVRQIVGGGVLLEEDHGELDGRGEQAAAHLLDLLEELAVVPSGPAHVPAAERVKAAAGLASRAAKRLLDLAVAVPAVVLLAPLLVLIALAVRLDSPGGALFAQTRVGRDGRPFRMLKFRSMRSDSDDGVHRAYVTKLLTESGASAQDGLFKLAGDPRVTRLGALLRRTSLDELPQLLNVLKGEMSVVGPRPQLAYEVEHLDAAYRERFSVKPGMTGLWQVSGRNRLSMRQALDLDVDYVRRRSLSLDLVILARTARAVLSTSEVR